MIINTDWINQGPKKLFYQRPKKTIETPKTPFSLSIAAIPGESIPFIGVAVLIVDTGYELYAACETVRDLDQLYVDLGRAWCVTLIAAYSQPKICLARKSCCIARLSAKAGST
jgi:hypothetical protein